MKWTGFIALLVAIPIMACGPSPSVPTIPPASTGVQASTSQAIETHTGISSPQISRRDLDYDNRPDAIIIYADVTVLRPLPSECFPRNYPQLRIWGDGLVFLETSTGAETTRSRWNGQLDHEQLLGTLQFLDGRGFFDQWDAGMPNPAGNWFHMGANLRSKSVAYSGGNLQPPLYTELVHQVMPHLKPLSEQTSDERIKRLFPETKPCAEGK